MTTSQTGEPTDRRTSRTRRAAVIELITSAAGTTLRCRTFTCRAILAVQRFTRTTPTRMPCCRAALRACKLNYNVRPKHGQTTRAQAAQGCRALAGGCLCGIIELVDRATNLAAAKRTRRVVRRTIVASAKPQAFTRPGASRFPVTTSA